MVGHGAELLHLVELRRLDDGERIFLAFDHLGLQRGIDLGEVDAGGRRAEGLVHRSPQRAHRNADLEACQILGRDDGLAARCRLAETVIPDFIHGDETRLADLAAHIGAEVAVHRLPHRVVVGEGKADAVDRGDRHQRRQDQARQGEELDRARPQLAQHVGIGAELVVGEYLQLEAAVGLLGDGVRRLLGADVERMRDRQVVGVFVAEIGGPRGPDRRHGQRRCGDRGGSKKISARQSSHLFLPVRRRRARHRRHSRPFS